MEKTSYLLTVGILSWNRKDALGLALESVKKQTIFECIETIVYDSNSSDGSPEYVEVNHPWAKLIKSDINPGLAEGRNILVRLAKAPIVFWMDDDCELVEDDLLEKMLNFMNSNKQVGVLYANIPEGDEKIPFMHLYIPQDLKRNDYGDKCLMTSSFASGATCVRRSLFMACGGYDNDFFRMNVENDFSYRVYSSGFCVCYYPDVTVIHRPHKSGRDYNAIMYFSLRNKLWGFWRNLPLSWAIMFTLLELPMGFLRAIQEGSIRAWFRAVKDAIMAMPRRSHLHKPISPSGLNIWSTVSHYIVLWQGNIPKCPDYSLGSCFMMEVNTRILARLGLWKRNPQKIMLSDFTLNQ